MISFCLYSVSWDHHWTMNVFLVVRRDCTVSTAVPHFARCSLLLYPRVSWVTSHSGFDHPCVKLNCQQFNYHCIDMFIITPDTHISSSKWFPRQFDPCHGFVERSTTGCRPLRLHSRSHSVAWDGLHHLILGLLLLLLSHLLLFGKLVHHLPLYIPHLHTGSDSFTTSISQCCTPLNTQTHAGFR